MGSVGGIDVERSRARRDARYRARELLNGLSSIDRLRACGRARARGDEGVPIVVGDGHAHFRNLQLCASVHACPVCAAKIRQRRAMEVEVAVRTHLAAGGGVEFVTLTLPHDQGDELRPLMDAVSRAYKAVAGGGGRAWMVDRDRFEIVGTIRALEVTHGPNGWHPHLHVLVFTAQPLKVQERVLLRDRFYARWRRGVVRQGYRPPTRTVGIDVRPVAGSKAIADYTSKVYDERRAGFELSRTDLKDSRRKVHRSAWAILGDLVEYGEADDLALWYEYEHASKGKRALVWSPGLKARFGIGTVDDQTIVDELVAGETVAVVSAALWPAVVRRRGMRARLLRVAETDGSAGLEELLGRLEADVFEPLVC